MSSVAATFCALCDDNIGAVPCDAHSLFRVANYGHHYRTGFVEAVHHETRRAEGTDEYRDPFL
ncbi:MAG: hypothetical protein QF532_07190 [Acidimicrobiales bacterium]|nr:hypothetical protein [Acidimicrobiales bacterium]